MIGAQFITDFGDLAVLLPLAGVLAAMFAMAGWRRGAIAWAAAVTGTLGLVLVLKLFGLSLGHRWVEPGLLHSPSGHTAAAATIYGGVLAVMVQRLTGRSGYTAAWSFLVALAMGSSRLLLDAHTGMDVVIGGSIGVAGACAFTALAGRSPLELDVRQVGIVTLLAVTLLHGLRLPAEAAIQTAALQIWPHPAATGTPR